MPAKSKAQQKLMAIAEHNPAAVSPQNRGVTKMSMKQLSDFASGSMKGKPAHANHPHASLGKYLHPKEG